MMRDVMLAEGLATEASDERAGFGGLQTDRGYLPLTSLDVRANVVGLLARVRVRQTFRNACDDALEATYIFPLPDRSAVTEFRLQVGERIVAGQLKERGEARAEYERALQEGHRAAIAEEDRSGTFNLRVGNIPPRQEVIVELTLTGPLEVAAGEATFRFPLVVAPRYTAGMPLEGASVGAGVVPDTDEVPDASRVTPPVLLPGFPNPVRLGLEVTIDPAGLLGVPGEDWTSRIRSSLHCVVTEQGPPWTLRLQPGERLNRDFVLRIPVLTQAVGGSLQYSAAAGSPGVFAVTLTPPKLPEDVQPRPREVVVVLDRSGSMAGWKMVAARRAVGRLIDTLLDQDRFTVVAFDSVIEMPPQTAGQLVPGTNRQRWQVLEWLGRLEARGGTEMGPALESALRLFAGDGASQRVLVLITDGQITGEDSVLRRLQTAARGPLPRIHTLGVDRAVNAGFLRRLADLGGGSCDLIESEDRLDEVMQHIQHQLGRPVLTHVRLEPVGGDWLTDSLAPSRLPDLFPDRPVTFLGRFRGEQVPLRMRVHARDSNGQPWSVDLAGQPGDGHVLTALWGRARVRDLEDRYASGQETDLPNLTRQIVAVSLEARVLSRFTAFVAVDRSEVVNPDGECREVVQPVELPAGWQQDAVLVVLRLRRGPWVCPRCRRMPVSKIRASFGSPGVSRPRGVVDSRCRPRRATKGRRMCRRSSAGFARNWRSAGADGWAAPKRPRFAPSSVSWPSYWRHGPRRD